MGANWGDEAAPAANHDRRRALAVVAPAEPVRAMRDLEQEIGRRRATLLNARRSMAQAWAGEQITYDRMCNEHTSPLDSSWWKADHSLLDAKFALVEAELSFHLLLRQWIAREPEWRALLDAAARDDAQELVEHMRSDALEGDADAARGYYAGGE